MNLGKLFRPVNVQPLRKRFGQQTPRRWGWGTPLKKRTATRIKFAVIVIISSQLSTLKTAVKNLLRFAFLCPVSKAQSRPILPKLTRRVNALRRDNSSD